MNEATPFIEVLVGKRLSHIWRGYGSAIFLEFGELISGENRHGKLGNPIGEISLMIECSWRIENPRSILGGSWSSVGRWQGMFDKILETTVTDVTFFGRIPEVCISLNGGRRVVSFSTVESQPQWTLLTRNPSLGSLHVNRGRISVESNGS